MTIQTIFCDGNKIYKKIYRKVYAGKNFAQYVEGFFGQRDTYKWGALIQLKGKERIMLRSFGKNGSGDTITHMEMVKDEEFIYMAQE